MPGMLAPIVREPGQRVRARARGHDVAAQVLSIAAVTSSTNGSSSTTSTLRDTRGLLATAPPPSIQQTGYARFPTLRGSTAGVEGRTGDRARNKAVGRGQSRSHQANALDANGASPARVRLRKPD